MNLKSILTTIAVPRPNHSNTLNTVIEYVKELLTGWGIQFTVQDFTLRPHMQLLVGYTCFILAVIFLFFILKKRPVGAFLAALAIPALLILEFELFIPVTSGIITRPGQNIIMSFPAAGAVRELIFCAHIDSKTDFLDHIQRARVYQWIPAAIVLGLLMPAWVLIAKKYSLLLKKSARVTTAALAIILVLYWGMVGLSFGGYVFLDRESFGAVDNGTSVTTLLALAKNIHDGKIDQGRSSVTVVITSGEEVSLQGAHAYVNNRFKSGTAETAVPPFLVNLELVAQKGNMIYWEKSGMFLKYYDTDIELRDRLNRVWKGISGTEMDSCEKITDDSQRFLAAGIPSITVGNSGLPGPGMGGFHSPLDCMNRVVFKNLDLMVLTLGRFIESYNKF